jgi:uncharacterized protein (TIGR02246 family)
MTTEDEEAIRSVITRLVDSWNRHDMHSFAALFTEDADFVDVFGNWFRNRAEIEGALTERHASVFRESSFIEKEVVIRIQKHDLAVVHSVLELSGAVDRQGQRLPLGLGVMTYVMDKVNGDWRVIAFQNTTITAPLPTAG